MKKIYAGIGSRTTPFLELEKLSETAHQLSKRGFFLRSGHARGADMAFEAMHSHNSRRIYTAQDAIPDIAFKIAEDHHTAWNNCSPEAKKLHARNSMIILGDACDDPVDFVVCWTPAGPNSGGTGQSIRVALNHDVPVFNTAIPGKLRELQEFVKANYA